jgi:hypothetical protein
MVTIVGHCRESAFQLIIDSLENELSKAGGIIDSLSTVVDSLETVISNIEPDYILVTLIKDVPNNVEIEKEFLYSNIETLTIINNQGDMGVTGLSYVYIVDTTGKQLDAIWARNFLYTDNLNSGAYFVIAIDENDKIWTFKFIK